jgi:hypothetical protein
MLISRYYSGIRPERLSKTMTDLRIINIPVDIRKMRLPNVITN